MHMYVHVHAFIDIYDVIYIHCTFIEHVFHGYRTCIKFYYIFSSWNALVIYLFAKKIMKQSFSLVLILKVFSSLILVFIFHMYRMKTVMILQLGGN